MKMYGFRAMLFVSLGCLFGCAKPDHILTIKSPWEGVFYTVETYYSNSLASDDTQVYVHLEGGGKETKRLVLDGEDMTVAKITWNGPNEATICIAGGFTETFRNEVILVLDQSSKDIYTHLQENCKFTPGNVTG